MSQAHEVQAELDRIDEEISQLLHQRQAKQRELAALLEAEQQPEEAEVEASARDATHAWVKRLF